MRVILNKLKRKVRTVVTNPKVLPLVMLTKCSPLLPDQLYLKLTFPLRTGYKLDLKEPKTYNEKLQWLKINYRKPIMTDMVDKFEAKKFAKKIVGDNHIIKTLGVWDTFDQIDFDALPDKFVLKTTHDQGGVVIVNDKTTWDKKSAKHKLTKHLRIQHFLLTREWPYKNVKPRIMAEELLENSDNSDVWDYKFYCFHGVPKIMYVSHGRHESVRYFDFFDMDFTRLDISRPGYQQSNKEIEKPESWNKMKNFAALLSAGFPHLRVDFYEVDEKLYLGELTFFQGGGMMPFYPQCWDVKMGELIDLDVVKKELAYENC